MMMEADRSIDDAVKLPAASAALGWRRVPRYCDVRQSLRPEVLRHGAYRTLPKYLARTIRNGIEPQGQCRGPRLHDLEPVDACKILHYGGKRERRQAYFRCVLIAQAQQLIAPARHPQCRKWTAASALFLRKNDAVAEIVANNRLHPVSEIREQYGMRRIARRHRLVTAVHGLEQNPVRIEMQRPAMTFTSDAHALGCAVFLEKPAMKGASQLCAAGA